MIKLIWIISASLLFVTDKDSSSGYQIGEFVDDFKLQNVDGKMIALSNYKNKKGCILIFSCNTCPWVKLYESRIIALHNKFDVEGYPVLTVNSNDSKKSPGDSFEQMKLRSKRMGYTFPYLWDQNQKIAIAFAATNTPQVFLLNNVDGKFRLEYVGAIDDNPRDSESVQINFVEQVIEALVDNREIEIKKAKAIGCTIIWKDV